MPSLKNGAVIPLADGKGSVTISGFIAEGGQGEVYKVNFNGRFYAMKWYCKEIPSDDFYNNLAKNIKMGSPGEHFLWPMAVTEKIKRKFGYVMKLCPANFKEYSKFLSGKVLFRSWASMFTAAFNIVESFLILHSIGYSYQDLNEGSFFIDPDNGDVLICDNDNVAPYGINLGVKGTPKYMAPEVELNISSPNTHTDRYSLAVILFRLFYIDHPLEGSYTIKFPLTDKNGMLLFGERPLFIYDPSNPANRPTLEAQPNVIKRWNMFPPDLKAAFTKAFTVGLKDVNSRITEQQWREILSKARGMLVKINGDEQFVNCYKPDTMPAECRLLCTEKQLIAVAPDTEIFMCEIDRTSIDYMTRAGIVKNTVRGFYVLKNQTNMKWRALLPNNSVMDIQPGGALPLVKGTEADFGNMKAKVY